MASDKLTVCLRTSSTWTTTLLHPPRARCRWGAPLFSPNQRWPLSHRSPSPSLWLWSGLRRAFARKGVSASARRAVVLDRSSPRSDIRRDARAQMRAATFQMCVGRARPAQPQALYTAIYPTSKAAPGERRDERRWGRGPPPQWAS